MKIFKITLLFTFLLSFNINAVAEKKDCSIYNTKTFFGSIDKRRCEKGLPVKERSTLGQTLNKLNPFKKKN